MNAAQPKTELALNPNDQWVKDANTTDNVWRKNHPSDEHGYVSQYNHTKAFCWQSVRYDHRVSGIAHTLDEAMLKADESLALPIEEFNNMVAERYLKELHEIERKILELKPAQKLLAGYRAGYEDGMAETKAKIAKALNLDDEEPSCPEKPNNSTRRTAVRAE